MNEEQLNQHTTIILEQEIISNLLNNKKYFNQVVYHLEPEYFEEEGCSLMFKNIKDYYLNFHKTPNLKELVLSFKDASKAQKELIKSTAKEVHAIKEKISESQLLELTQKHIKQAIFKEAIIKGADSLSSNDESLMIESFAIAEQAVKVTLDEDLGVSLEDIDQVYDEFQEKPGVQLGIPSFDNMIGSGFTPKTLHSAMAASGVGKSAAMTAFAVQFLLKKKDVVFITLEMSEAEVSKRIYANLYDVDIATLPVMDKQAIKNKYKQVRDSIGQLVTKEFSMGSLTPMQLDGYLAKLENERNIKNPIVIVDYLGLMSSDRMKNADNSYAYFGSIAEELRAVAQKRDLIMFTPLQLNRSAVNNLEADQSALSESMKILMTVDSAFIISQTPEMKEQGKMKINFVKNRMSGKTWSFEIGFDYRKFRFDDRFYMGGGNVTAQDNSTNAGGLGGLSDLMSM